MERRKFVLSLGALAAGGGAAVGTGAFSAVGASRDVTVDVAGDAGAYLGIKPHPSENGAYADIKPNGELALDFTGSNSNIGGEIAGGKGINANAISSFGGVFRIENQGTQDVELSVTPIGFVELTSGSNLELLVVLIVPGTSSWQLSPGDYKDFHVLAGTLQTDGDPSIEIHDEIEITAEEV